MPATRLLPTEEATALLGLVRDVARNELLPRAEEAEADAAFPREVFRMLGELGLLSLSWPEEYGGGGQPYEVYLQVLEEIGAVWASVGVGVSVHSLSCFGLATAGSEEQRQRWLPGMLDGTQLGAYCLSEPHAGSDPAAMRASAHRTRSSEGEEYVLNGTKACTTHGGEADFYQVMARTGEGPRGISCFLVPADTPGLTAAIPSRPASSPASAKVMQIFEGTNQIQRMVIGRHLDAEA